MPIIGTVTFETTLGTMWAYSIFYNVAAPHFTLLCVFIFPIINHLLYLISVLQAPALEIQDKISFIINNISAANVEAKAKEFTEIFKEQYYPWFAQYMVMKRLQSWWVIFGFM